MSLRVLFMTMLPLNQKIWTFEWVQPIDQCSFQPHATLSIVNQNNWIERLIFVCVILAEASQPASLVLLGGTTRQQPPFRCAGEIIKTSYESPWTCPQWRPTNSLYHWVFLSDTEFFLYIYNKGILTEMIKGVKWMALKPSVSDQKPRLMPHYRLHSGTLVASPLVIQ